MHQPAALAACQAYEARQRLACAPHECVAELVGCVAPPRLFALQLRKEFEQELKKLQEADATRPKK